MSASSDLSLFLKGQISDPNALIATLAADIKKATAWFQALPFAKAFEGWLIDLIYARLAAAIGATAAALICHEVKVLLGIQDPVGPPTV